LSDVRSLPVAIILSMLSLGAVACDGPGPMPSPDPCKPVQTDIAFSYQPPLLPLKLTVTTAGRVSVAFVASWVTVFGTFSAGPEGSHNFVRTRATSHLLVLKTIEDGELKETGIEIKCDNEYRVFINGQVTATITTERTEIEARPNTESTIALVDKASKLDPDLKPLPEYELAHDREPLGLPDTLGLYGVGMDLDALQSHDGMDSDDADVRDDYAVGLQSGFHGSTGFTDRPAPTPAECRVDAESRPIGTLELADVRVGQGFCVVTSKSNVAFLKVTGRRGPYSERYALSFEATVWTRMP
jgi:hypothetical protein